MERGSDKHNPRLDENLERDTRSMVQGSPVESRAEENREQEGPADGEPTPDALLTGGRTEEPNGTVLTHDEVEARSALARSLPPSVFPADRDALLAAAAEQGAGDTVLSRLSAVPDGTYANFEGVWKALGGRSEHRG